MPVLARDRRPDHAFPRQAPAQLLFDFAAGRALLEAGVVSGYDMTTEAALAKLYYLLEKRFSPARVRELMQRSLHGELTEPVSAQGEVERLPWAAHDRVDPS